MIWGVVLLLSLLSLLVVYSSTCSLAYRMAKSSNYYLIKQLVVLGFGLVITYFVHKVNYTQFAKVAVIAYFISLPLLIFTLFFGAKINHGARWIPIPILGITFQSSDLAKLALFMFLARQLSLKQNDIKDLKTGFLPVLIPVFTTCLFIAPENLSTALMLGLTCTILFFIGRVRMRHLLLLAVLGIFFVTTLFVVSKVTGFGRASIWEARMKDYLGNKPAGGKHKDVYQVEQAKIAIANGGLLGLGPGNSRQRNNLPEAFSDFIYAIIIEEYGLLGGGIIIILYLVLLWQSITIFRRCPRAFGAFLAVGLSITLVFQAMLNMAVNVHLVPVTGLTLPLVSMGGSSIWFNSVAIGIILSVSRYVDEMEGEQQASPKAKAVPKPQPTVPAESKIFVETPKPEKMGNRLKNSENNIQPTL